MYLSSNQLHKRLTVIATVTTFYRCYKSNEYFFIAERDLLQSIHFGPMEKNRLQMKRTHTVRGKRKIPHIYALYLSNIG